GRTAGCGPRAAREVGLTSSPPAPLLALGGTPRRPPTPPRGSRLPAARAQAPASGRGARVRLAPRPRARPPARPARARRARPPALAGRRAWGGAVDPGMGERGPRRRSGKGSARRLCGPACVPRPLAVRRAFRFFLGRFGENATRPPYSGGTRRG